MYSDHHSKPTKTTKHIMLKYELIDETGTKIARGYSPAISAMNDLVALVNTYTGAK